MQLVCPHCHGVNRVPDTRLSDQPKCGRCKQPLFSSAPIALDGIGFERFLSKSDIPLLVDFWAPWCGPCRMMAPAFEQAARLLEPKVQLIKINTEEQQSVAAKYAIRSIPTLILFKAGIESARMSGAMDAKGLVAWTEQNL
ncbi:MAG: thioredoxin TrxC [Sedimenticola thiotaurini]|uniref:Thioredoxin n=1 Tax=Sedimenticola thiotaurini TaxID=1543721 RepID=A0A558CUU2_9GAMM|nr:MAG: thioredoxin TrxC [Sedimenticola thiotaurini]